MVHQSTQRAAGAACLVQQAKLNAPQVDFCLRLVAFPLALGMLAVPRVLCVIQTAGQVANVLISNAACWGAEGPPT